MAIGMPLAAGPPHTVPYYAELSFPLPGMLGVVPADYGPASGPKLEILDKQIVNEDPQSGKAEAV